MKEYLLYMAQVHLNFRRAELESLADLGGISLDFASYDPESPFWVVQLESDDQARALVKRSILTKAVFEYWGSGPDYESLHRDVQSRPGYDERRIRVAQDSFKFEFENYHGKHKRDMSEKIRIIDGFQYLGLEGTIDLKKPKQMYTIIEEYGRINSQETTDEPLRLRFGRHVQTSDRSAMDLLDLKKRPYCGTTSFEAELSLVTANIAQVKPGTLMYDPFAGTGSFLVAGGHYGALVVGSDIDGRMIRGKGANANISANFKKYGMEGRFLDVLTMDFTHNSLRTGLPIDTIVCDPPYGIRESIKILGARDPEKFEGKEKVMIDGRPSYLNRDYIPTKKPYSLDALLDDLLQFACERLPLGGRLAFWMPTANGENLETVIPLHGNLELKYHCTQEFNKWARRLLVYINRGPNYHGPTNTGVKRSSKAFRDHYFSNANR
ncbi:tRNA (guanine-N2-)-methyltransferase KNAG_0A01360 [Huiozyma naganishii CBS 8797]|uniref:tRNA (guanine(10)-N(2))-methyltransferase n=1 Tax=Huiozyma naganishii (strain ATCC MYA-139 / BCRC 22969 / CBS 8797 / KCTC 17520 / NBRC 10181 / NCYC 3082 / Yp74L-3) TaxID=1071383 RepID=J7QZD6_HUIN7|nr:hypothetical protein KNAG_0A01360 [Kazachstania naganishii CBS 8797]CCK67825.1 hypothetical protein KNAG_0A01360 [Kazachstania naganishii CBS 8797]